MPDFEVLIGQRVVSNVPVTTDELALAFAPDDMFVIGINPIRTDDPHAIGIRDQDARHVAGDTPACRPGECAARRAR